MGELDSFLLFGSESSRAELFTRVRVAKPTNTPLEPTAEKRGGSEAESLCVRPILRRSCEWS